MWERTKWTCDQASANVTATNYSTLPPVLGASLGYPMSHSDYGASTINSSQFQGMHYQYTCKVEFYNPSNVCVYGRIQIHTSKTRPSAVGGNTGNGTDLGNASPLDAFNNTKDQDGRNRFYVSTQNNDYTVGALSVLPDVSVGRATNVFAEVNMKDVTKIGTKLSGPNFSKYFANQAEIPFILPPGATLEFYIRKPESFYDYSTYAANATSTSAGGIASKHTFWMSVSHYGQLGFDTRTTGDGANNWGETTSELYSRVSESYRCQFHTKKFPQSLNVVNTGSYIQADSVSTRATGDQNLSVAASTNN
jgi:hypothetical protein